MKTILFHIELWFKVLWIALVLLNSKLVEYKFYSIQPTKLICKNNEKTWLVDSKLVHKTLYFIIIDMFFGQLQLYLSLKVQA